MLHVDACDRYTRLCKECSSDRVLQMSVLHRISVSWVVSNQAMELVYGRYSRDMFRIGGISYEALTLCSSIVRLL